MKAIMTVALALGFTLASQAQSLRNTRQSSELPARTSVEVEQTTSNRVALRRAKKATQVNTREIRTTLRRSNRERLVAPDPNANGRSESLRRR